MIVVDSVPSAIEDERPKAKKPKPRPKPRKKEATPPPVADVIVLSDSELSSVGSPSQPARSRLETSAPLSIETEKENENGIDAPPGSDDEDELLLGRKAKAKKPRKVTRDEDEEPMRESHPPPDEPLENLELPVSTHYVFGVQCLTYLQLGATEKETEETEGEDSTRCGPTCRNDAAMRRH